MKLVEIKNSLAKFYYKPAEFPLVISDFLTLNDGNQKLLAQVVSLESTSKDDTNCAILKFSLDINTDGTYCTYSGYTPAIDAKVEKASAKLIETIFSGAPKAFCIGNLTNSTKVGLNINAQILDNFLYIQSDTHNNTKMLFEKIAQFNKDYFKKTLVIDFDGIFECKDANEIELGKSFKLPINNEILNYIYEYDLTGLTVEQKTIVQDIILEIQEYIETLEEKYIPFTSLLDVVNSVYETDKSTGVILLRNKLLKYNQQNIFASSTGEVTALTNAMQCNNLNVLDLSQVTPNWQKKTLDFILNNIDCPFYLIANVSNENTDKELINKLYKAKNIKSVIASSYDCEHASQLKSFAKNLILFKPQDQQKAFATYNSFLSKLSENEFVVSGASTYYTPLIVSELLEKFTLSVKEQSQTEDVKEPAQNTFLQQEEIIDTEENIIIEEDIPFLDATEEIQPLENLEESNELKNIFDESLEDEIAKDVDQMFYGGEQQTNTENQTPEEISINYDDMFSDEDLDMLDSINSDNNDDETLLEENSGVLPLMEESQPLPMIDNSSIIEGFDTYSTEDPTILPDNLLNDEHETDSFINIEEIPDTTEEQQQEENIEIKQENILENITENTSLPGLPIYKPEEPIHSDDKIQIAEGNIVYHERFGRGVVEELINYGNRTLCSIQFDNVGRRLLDPTVADIKQM